VTDIARRIDAVWRIESPKLIGGLARLVRDVGLAEELAQDALVAALETWPRTGMPQNPGAWLMLTARRRAIDRFRREQLARDKAGEIAREMQEHADAAAARIEAALDDDIGDERLALIFTACHPVLGRDARVALTLRLLCGLTTAEIARAFLIGVPAVAQRITRAKKVLAEAGAGFEVPRGAARADRLAAVHEVVYLLFNEGHTATSGADWTRPDLAHEALRLGRILAELMPDEPETLGLLALMELQASRLPARTDAAGDPILLADQDRSRWDRLLIRRGLAAFARAEDLAPTPGPYQLQAAIAACHATALAAPETDWVRIAALYAALMQASPSPVIELNRAVAIGMAFGPEQGLAIADTLRDEPALAGYHLLPAVRADLLERAGRWDEAAAEYVRAAALAGNQRDRALLEARARALGG